MNARELHDEFRDANALDRDALVRQHSATILRALSLLAAVDESDGLVRELRDCFLCTSEKYEPRLHFVLDKAAARIVALEASISAERANGERERGIRDQHITRLESELASVKRLYDCGIRAFKELDSLLAQVLAAQSELASASRQAAARIDEQVAELASMKAHAEAMAELLDLQLGTQAAGTWEWKRETAPILEAYRAAHPKEGT